MQKVTEKNYDEIVSGAGAAVVLTFDSMWCGTCQSLESVLEELSREKKGRLLIAKVDIAESASVALRFDVIGVPTVVFLRDGKPVHRITGPASKENISRMLARHLGV
jgi:thioredoxin 1